MAIADALLPSRMRSAGYRRNRRSCTKRFSRIARSGPTTPKHRARDLCALVDQTENAQDDSRFEVNGKAWIVAAGEDLRNSVQIQLSRVFPNSIRHWLRERLATGFELLRGGNGVFLWRAHIEELTP